MIYFNEITKLLNGKFIDRVGTCGIVPLDKRKNVYHLIADCKRIGSKRELENYGLFEVNGHDPKIICLWMNKKVEIDTNYTDVRLVKC